MSIFAPERGSEAIWLHGQPLLPDQYHQSSVALATLLAAPPAHLHPDHAKRKPRPTMTITQVREETLTSAIPIALPPTSPSRATRLIRRLRAFWASIPLEHELDTVNLRREITLHRLQLK